MHLLVGRGSSCGHLSSSAQTAAFLWGSVTASSTLDTRRRCFPLNTLPRLNEEPWFSLVKAEARYQGLQIPRESKGELNTGTYWK